MGSFVKKDLLLMLRDRKELAILVLMPFILIAILGFALGGFLNGETSLNLHMSFIVVDEDDEVAGKERLVHEIESSPHYSDEQKVQLIQVIQNIGTHEMLYGLLDHEEFAATSEYQVMNLDDARQELKKDRVAAIVHIPPGFSYDMLSKMVLGKGTEASLRIEGSSSYEISSSILQDILMDFAHQVNFQSSLNRLGQETGEVIIIQDAPVQPETRLGGIENVSVNEPVNSSQYFTIGMAVMFVMYVATSMAVKAFAERRQFTFDRILITGTHPLRFLSGKFVSTVILAFLQLTLLFILSTLVFQTFVGQSVEFWFWMVIITLALAINVGGLATLLTSLSFRSGNEGLIQIFAGLLVTILAVLGGSFFPTSQMPEALAEIGRWVPNGSALYSYTQLVQGAGIDKIGVMIVRILVMAVVFIGASLWLFPRRKVG